MKREKLSDWGVVPPASSREDNQVKSDLFAILFGGFLVKHQI